MPKQKKAVKKSPAHKHAKKPVHSAVHHAKEHAAAHEAKPEHVASVEKKPAAKKKQLSKIVDSELWKVVRFPHLSEKSIANIEAQNKLVFIVDGGASRHDVKEAVEKLFSVKVVKVNILNTAKGEKKAFVRLDAKNSAADIATRMGMM